MFDFGQLPVDNNFTTMKPGVNIPVILERIEITPKTDKSEGGDLDIYFKGTSLDHAGYFKPRFWANNFDKKADKYNEDSAINALKQLRQIAEAYLPAESVAKIKGTSWKELREAFVTQMKTVDFSKIPTLVKAVYKYNNDKDLVIPNFGAFISTEINPQGLVLSDKSKNGVPYDRILPLSNYASATSSIPGEDNFSVEEEFDFPSEDDAPAFN